METLERLREHYDKIKDQKKIDPRYKESVTLRIRVKKLEHVLDGIEATANQTHIKYHLIVKEVRKLFKQYRNDKS